MLIQWIQMLLHITLVTGNQRSTVICMKHINKGLYLHVVTDINLVYFFLKGRTWLRTLQMTCMTMLILSPHISNFMGTLLLNNISLSSPFVAVLPITCPNYTLSLLRAVLCLIYCTAMMTVFLINSSSLSMYSSALRLH